MFSSSHEASSRTHKNYLRILFSFGILRHGKHREIVFPVIFARPFNIKLSIELSSLHVKLNVNHT